MKKRSNLKRYISKIIQESQSAKKKHVDTYIYCDYNQVISAKFYKFLELAMSLPFEFYFENDNIILNLNLTNPNQNNTGAIGFADEYVSFSITKTHFKITRNHADVCGYRDPHIYTLFFDKIKESYERRSAEMFHNTINDILDMFPAIGREFKIDEILID